MRIGILFALLLLLLASSVFVASASQAKCNLDTGADFLLAHRVHIAYSQSKVHFTPIAGEPYFGAGSR